MLQDVPPVIVSACSAVSRSELIQAGVVRADRLGASGRQGVRASELAGLAAVGLVRACCDFILIYYI